MPHALFSPYRSVKFAFVLGLLITAVSGEAQTSPCERALAKMATGDRTLQIPDEIEDQRFQGFEKNLESLAQIREAVAAAGLGDLNGIDLVVYPFSGVDAGTPAALFPASTTIIGHDSIPFAGENTSWFINKDKVKGAELGFATYREIDEIQAYDEAAAAHIVQSLRSFVPHCRVRRIEEYEGPPIEADEPPRSHGVVEFDSGEGTPVRHYIHLNGYIQLSSDVAMGYEPPFLIETILGGQIPDAVLVKASMGRLNFAMGVPRLRSAIVEWLSRGKGVLVEGEEQLDDENAAARPEFSLDETIGNVVRIAVPTERFGYTGRAHVTRFR